MTTRRDFLGRLSRLSLAAAGLPALAPWIVQPRWSADPFTLGVASGDPLPTGVVLWTRLLPDVPDEALAVGANIGVRWEVAEDDAMRRIVRRGVATASPDFAYSVHAEVDGLRPDRWYWYRFMVGGATSPVGRTRTAPDPRTTPDRLRLAFASCQHYEQGLFTAHQHLAEEDVDVVLFLGDYIYESTAPGRPRQHGAPPPVTLGDYRARYALYKRDPALQASHLAFPWIATWDDHEVENNYAGASPSTPKDGFLLQRAAAYRAFYEHQPLRRASLPKGADMLLYRALSWGTLGRFQVLDGRQYRSDQACGDGTKDVPCGDWAAPERTMLGRTQERWVERGLQRSHARWNVLAQQVMIAPIDADPGAGRRYAMDRWTGYPAAMERITTYMARRATRDTVVLTGDIHTNFAAEVRASYDDLASPPVAAEFVGSSMSSGGDGSAMWPRGEAMLAANPWLRHHQNRRGYVRCVVTPDEWRSDYRTVPFVERPGAPIATDATWVVRRGDATLQRG